LLKRERDGKGFLNVHMYTLLIKGNFKKKENMGDPVKKYPVVSIPLMLI